MSLAYRLGTVAFIMGLMALALYILTAGILGRKIHWKSMGIFFACGEVFQWAATILYVLYTMVTGEMDMPSAVFDTVCWPGVKFCVSDFRQSQEWRWKTGRILAWIP